MISSCFKILDTQTVYAVRLERGVAEIREESPVAADLLIELETDVWGEIVLGLTGLAEARQAGRLRVTGDPTAFAALSRALRTGVEAFREHPERRHQP